MENFRFENKTKILFGRGTEEKAGEYVSEISDSVLVLYGSDRIEKNGLLDTIKASLENKRISAFYLSGVKPNPCLSTVYQGIDLCRAEGIGCILAVGGGSVIDTAKAIAIGVDSDTDVWDFFCHKKNISSVSVKIGVVLTIAAAGSESSGSSVITNDLITPAEKRDVTSNLIRPSFAILNPELTLTLPWNETAYGGIDILSHVMERYFTKVSNVELTDRLCEAVMITVINNLRKIKEDPLDYDARAEVMWASTVAHSNILSTGRRSDWASHMIEHELSAYFNIPHGKGLAMVIPSWMKYVYKRDIDRFAQYAVRVWNIDGKGKSSEEIAKQGIGMTELFYEEMRQESNAVSLKLTETQIEDIAGSAVKYGDIGDFVRLGKDDVIKILKMASGID